MSFDNYNNELGLLTFTSQCHGGATRPKERSGRGGKGIFMSSDWTCICPMSVVGWTRQTDRISV